MVLVAMLCSCHNRTQNPENAGSANTEERTSERLDETCITYATEYDTVRHAKLKYFDFDGIDDLTGYFHTLAAEYPIANWHGEECDVNTTAMECIAAVDAYRKGERRFYPYSLVRECIGSMGFNIAVVNNHGTDMTDLALAEWVMMCAAYYSPDITCLVETQTPDHHAGFYNFGEAYNLGPWWAYLFLKREKGYEVVGLGDFVKVRGAFLPLAEGRDLPMVSVAPSMSAALMTMGSTWMASDSNVPSTTTAYSPLTTLILLSSSTSSIVLSFTSSICKGMVRSRT